MNGVIVSKHVNTVYDLRSLVQQLMLWLAIELLLDKFDRLIKQNSPVEWEKYLWITRYLFQISNLINLPFIHVVDVVIDTCLRA